MMPKPHATYPTISILIAARNEEQNIISCLQAIELLDYPSEKLEVWVGDDDSTDQTHRLITAFIEDKPQFHLKSIKENIGLAKGKANVLAQLARLATGELFCITDADVIVPSTWLKGLLLNYEPKIGMLTGITAVEGPSLFAKLQGIDWLNALSLIKLASDVGQPVTAMGNNLLVSQEAYFSVGGYEHIPFSVTEDFELFRQVKQQNWKIKQLFSLDVLAKTKPVTTWRALLQQRKRWMVGAMQIQWYIKMLLALQVLFYPMIILMAFTNTFLALTVYFVKWFLQSAWIAIHLIKIRQQQFIPYLIFYEPYVMVLTLSSAVYHYLAIPIKWKGRVYH